MLQSWKEIAGFFDVTVRTVQNWEEERGLPIHRMPGAKGRIYAYVDELEAWRKQTEGTRAAAVTEPEPAEVPAVQAASRKPLILAAVSCLILACIGVFWVLRPRSNPNLCRVEGRTLVVYDEQGRLAWRYILPNEPVEEFTPDFQTYDSWRIVDVDGDGRREILFPLRYGADSRLDDELYLFSADGQVLWQRSFAKPVLRQGVSLKGTFGIRRFALVPIPGKKESRVVVASTHHIHSPALITLLDARGNLLREYWHAGHITTMLVDDLDSDGRPEIFLGGIANGYKCADLTVLDPEKFGGASVEAEPAEQIQQNPPAVEKARLLLPRSSLNLATSPYNYVGSLMRVGDSLLVATSENPAGAEKASNLYYFNPRLELEKVEPADMNRASFRKLYQQRVIPSDLTEEEIASYRKIRILTPWKQ
ncbi:MAG: hypothetical protein J0H49_37415 [Acidobacteria bacterium]|nr:hypothetical protein [Acidobacteriota bacterium]